MKKLLCYLKGYEKETVLAPLFKMLEALFELLIALGVIGVVCSITAQYFAAKAATGFSTRLRHELFAHIQGLSYTEMDTLGTSTLITRMTSDINQVQSGVNLVLRLFLRSPFIVFGAMIMAFTVDAKADRAAEIRWQNLRSDEPHYLCDRQRFDHCAVVYRRDPCRFRHPDPGTDRSACQLHVPDSGGACQAGESDYFHDKSLCLRRTHQQCV